MRKEMITVAIADGYALRREGIRCICSRFRGIEVTDEAEDGFAALELVRKACPDIMLLSLPLPRRDGLDTTRDIASAGTGTQAVVVAEGSAQGYALRLLRAGARGFIPTSASGDELVEAIRTVHRGGIYLPMELQRAFAERYLRPEARDEEDLLSEREFQVLCLLASGSTNKEAADKLCISVKTVDTHRGHILRKLSLRNNADLARYAIKRQYIPL